MRDSKINKNYLFLSSVILLVFLTSGFSSLALNTENYKINSIEIVKKFNDYLKKYDYLVVNDKLKDTVEAVESIILAERHSIER